MDRFRSFLFCVLAVAACKTHQTAVSITPADEAFMREAIRAACRALDTFDLDGCVIYTSCEPCPMCLGAIYWAGIDRIYYANTRQDAEAIAFADNFIYEDMDRPMAQRNIPIIQLLRDEAQSAFRAWTEKVDKTEY